MSTPTRTERGSRLRIRATAVGVATLAATIVWLLAVPLLGYDLAVERWDSDATMTVTLGHVIATALLASAAGWLALAILERQTRRAPTIWTTGALVVLVASVGMPFTAAASTSAAVVLALMHVAVGAVLIPALARSLR